MMDDALPSLRCLSFQGAQAERQQCHLAALQQQKLEEVLAPGDGTSKEPRDAALALLAAGLLALDLAGPRPQIRRSPLFCADEAVGACFQGAPEVGEAFADCAVEDLELEVEAKAAPPEEAKSRGFLLGHLGPFFTLVVFCLSVEDVPWEALRQLDRSNFQLTLELVRKVVVVLDASSLERMSERHVEAVARAARLGARLLADRSRACGAYDARPGTAVLLRPDSLVAARWRQLGDERDVQRAFLRATGHLLHVVPRVPSPRSSASGDEPQLRLQPWQGCALLRHLQMPAQQAVAALMLLASYLGEAPVLEAVEMAKAALKKDLGEVKPLKLSLPAKEPGPVPPADVLSVVKSLAEEGAGLVPLELAVDTMHKMLKQEPEILASMAPEQGVEELRELLAKQLTEAEGQEVLASQVMVADGAKALEALLWELDEAARRTPQEPREVLVVGCCPEQWSTALDAWQVRHYFPSGECFEVVAADVAAHVTGRTVAVLLPLYGLATGVPLTQAELARLGHFVDFEAARRRSSGGSLPLALLVDVGLRSLQLDAQAECLPVLRHCRSCALLGDLFGEWSAAPKLLAQFVALGAGLSQYCPRAAPTVALVQRLAAQLPLEPRSLEGLRRRRQILLEALSRAGLQVLGKPRAGGHMLARLPEDIAESEYCEALARHGVPAQQGTLLGCPGCVRLCFSLRFDLLEDSVPLFAQAVQEVRRKTFMVKPQAEPKEHTEPKVPTETAPEVTAVDLARSNEAVAGPEEPSPPEAKAAEEAAEAREAGTEPKAEETKAEEPKVEEPKVEPSPEAQVPPEEEDAGEEDEEEQEESVAEESADAGDVDEDLAVDEAALAAAQQRGEVAPLGPQLRRNLRAVACVAQLSGAIATELIAQAGFELIIVDHEYGPGDFFSAANLVRSAAGAGAHAMLRLPCADATQVYRALEAGAEGLLLGQVTSRQQAEAFARLVAHVSEKARDDAYVEWRSSPPPPLEEAPAPRPLVAVELEPSCAIATAEELLRAEGVDLVMVDPERCLEALLGQYRSDDLGGTGFPPRVPAATVPAGYTMEETKEGEEPEGPPTATVAEPSPPPGPPPGARRTVTLALKAPQLSTRMRAVGGAAPLQAAEAMQSFWSCFDALPQVARDNRKLIGCTAHARNTALDLLIQGHSVVALCADLVLLREGAHRHANEMKTERAGAGTRHWAAPLESQRARLATSALVSQLRRHKKALAAFLHLGDALAAENLCMAGFEAVVLDHEQGPGDLLNAVGLVHAASSAGTHPLLRVPSNDPAYLRRALQLGVEGLILPMTESASQAEDFIAAVKKSFPSSSLRGAGGTAAALRSAAPQAAQFLRRREELLLKAVQVETEAGLAAVKDIAKVDGLDMVFFAPVELAASAPRGQEAGLLLALETAEAEVKRAKKLLGGMLVPGRSAEQMFSAGYDLVCTTSDVILIRAAAENIVRESKPPATGPKAGLVQWVTSAREAKFARNEETLVMRLKKSRQARALAVMARLGSARAAELVASSGFE
ncbi:unnamed protein product, partial [Effrenium voratum]